MEEIMQIEQTIADKVNSYNDGQYKIACPSCGNARKKRGQKTLSIKIENSNILYNCWHCGLNGVVNSNGEYKIKKEKEIDIMPIAVKRNWDDLSDKAIDWLKTRGISEKTARDAKIKSGLHYINSIQQETDCIVFPYHNQGQFYASKIRSLSDKGFACSGAPASFFNLEGAIGGDDLFICEGEIDALTMLECGFESSVSVPNGAVMKVVDGKIDPQEDNKFKFLWDAKKQIDRASRVVICTDNDTAGQAMGEEIARRIGKDRCWLVEYPDGCKDLNDILVKKGAKKVHQTIANMKPYPVSGLYDASHFYEQIDEIYEKGMGKGASTGYACVDELYSIVEGQLTVVTGHPSSGKSEFVDQLMVNLAEKVDWKFAVCSFENEPRIHIAKLISKYFRKPFFSGITPRLSREDLDIGKKFVQTHFTFLYQNDGTMATVEDIIERLKIAVMRHGIRGAVIDPYNYIQKKGDISETDWISEMLTQLRIFTQAHGIHLWFVAHPTKMMRGADGKVPVPKGYDISGSAAWFAKADLGMSVHRPDPINSSVSEVHIWKCRFSWVGKQGVAELFFDPITSRYNENIQDGFADMDANLQDAPL